jgi:tetratricopeptide (TPR) repeat protein
VKAVAPVDPEQFIAAVKPYLERRDLSGLLEMVKARWTAGQVVDMLASPNCDARKLAALSLALVGGPCCIKELADRLRDRDPMVNQMAEHALWAIWFRGGDPDANHEVCRGAKALERKDLEHAISHFDKALRISPDFAEAYNQRAIAYYLMERYEDSIKDCLQTVERMPCHFGAWAGLGHCEAHLGRTRDAIGSYERALEINPHLDCIKQTIAELKQRLA